MKRKLLALLLASVMVLSLVACGQKETPDTPETPDDQEEVKDYSGYTIRIYSNSNSTERTTWLIQEAKDAGFTISIDDNSVISGDTAARPPMRTRTATSSSASTRPAGVRSSTAFTRTSSSLTGLPPGQVRSASTPIPARPTASSSRTF